MFAKFLQKLLDCINEENRDGYFINYRQVPKISHDISSGCDNINNYKKLTIEKEVLKPAQEFDINTARRNPAQNIDLRGFGKLKWID